MYKLTQEGYVIRLSDMARIAITDTSERPNINEHYLEYEQWLAAGNTPEPADPLPVEVPQQVTSRQGKLALLETPYNEQVSMLEAVEALIDSIQSNKKRKAVLIEYNNYIWERDNETLQEMWLTLGKTFKELDDMFILAGTK